MEIIRHLSNQELTDIVLESDQQALRQTLDALPVWARTATDRPEEFWQLQRNLIRSRIAARERQPRCLTARRSLTLAGSVLAAMVLLAGLMLNRAPVVPPHAAQVDPDHELLLAVERAVHNDGPAALDPAALLAEEMVQELPPSNSPVRKKEPAHEN
ncbi:MAG: hypothetical protein ACRD20_19160 [Terriglobales bacterium]